ncbi:MAG: sigma-54-dependent Fis family transcriptional regulator [Desulfobulbaceae bacterium]|uniref:Sigma-54-dependent Fis family transcriptional regulator n=1 Tax=Candidatus Desulfobia pelagia TaxID=2841692 RepID=A0A8J6N815_9BACT|nr:sigma-54-dependent Fis family transcriptional regulator [Candidatus Desulfobia pelagia]
MTPQSRKILIADDDREVRILLYEVLSRDGYDVVVAESLMAMDMIQLSSFDLVIADMATAEADGLELLQKIKKHDPSLPVVIITGHPTVETAVAALKYGAADYLLKPLSIELLEDVVSRELSKASVPKNTETTPVVDRKQEQKKREIIGSNDKLAVLMQKARSVASSKATVLILGESGTGKEMFARYLHNESNRKKGPFVALNCAALPEGLLESELFGHEKGAFTGAVSSKKGRFELAHGGTLLLDEIGEIPLHLQAKLLRVLQEEEVDRLGGQAPVKIDVHVVATTNRNLAEAVNEGTFRQDLYYRLNVIPLPLPPLRARKDDILKLADHFMKKFSKQYHKKMKILSEASQSRFLDYPWPGNVREMENVIERAVLLSLTEEFEPWDFWDDIAPEERIAPGGVYPQVIPVSSGDQEIIPLKDTERQMILQALQKTDDNRTHAAKRLGISVRTLRNKLQEYRNQGVID